jgi:hypothetical protein
MVDQLVWLLAGAVGITVLGRWSKQNRIVVFGLCVLWGGISTLVR